MKAKHQLDELHATQLATQLAATQPATHASEHEMFGATAEAAQVGEAAKAADARDARVAAKGRSKLLREVIGEILPGLDSTLTQFFGEVIERWIDSGETEDVLTAELVPVLISSTQVEDEDEAMDVVAHIMDSLAEVDHGVGRAVNKVKRRAHEIRDKLQGADESTDAQVDAALSAALDGGESKHGPKEGSKEGSRESKEVARSGGSAVSTEAAILADGLDLANTNDVDGPSDMFDASPADSELLCLALEFMRCRGAPHGTPAPCRSCDS